MKKIVVAIYSHPEFYPPTLNAVRGLSEHFDEVIIVSRNVFKSHWEYPANVTCKTSGKYTSIRDSEKKPFLWKLFSFLQFTWLLFKQVRHHKPVMILLYDPVPLFSYSLVRSFIKPAPLLWYHNHDVAQPGANRKYSIGYWSEKNEQPAFRFIDLFTLPAADRRQFFPLAGGKPQVFIVPNYPSAFYYNKFKLQRRPFNESAVIKLIYQGSIGKGHGLEDIIGILSHAVNNKHLTLTLKGFISDEYKKELQLQAERLNVADKLEFIGPGPYSEVPAIASQCHIGIGIHVNKDRMNSTLGTASNKIYEYAAAGMPVLLYDNDHFKNYLQQYSWAFFTDCSSRSLLQHITTIAGNYEQYAGKALADFLSVLNFENAFDHVLQYVDSRIEQVRMQENTAECESQSI